MTIAEQLSSRFQLKEGCSHIQNRVTTTMMVSLTSADNVIETVDNVTENKENVTKKTVTMLL